MIQEIRALARRVSGLERSLQRPTQEIRDDGDLRLRWGRQPDGAWDYRRFDALGAPTGMVDVVTSLPASPYDGQTVRYRHTTSIPPYLAVWDPTLNAGAGAWHVIGPAALLHGQSSTGDQSTASVATWAAMTNTPTLTVPPGVWDIDARGSIQQLGPTAANGRVALRLNGAASDVIGAGWSGGDGQVATATRGPIRKTFTANTTITLAVATNNVTMRFGGPNPAGLWQLSVTPVELRP